MKVTVKTERREIPNPRIVDDRAWSLDSLKSINWNNSSDRKWLANHMHWAMHNDCRVIVRPESN